MKRRTLQHLTPREREVLALMASGLTNAAIAERLQISFATAKTHVSDILSRLDVESREEAVALWRSERGPRGALSRIRAVSWVPFAATAAGLIGLVAIAGVIRQLNPDESARELRISLAALTPGVPASYSATDFGADSSGRSYDLWLVRHEDRSVTALLGRDPRTGCIVPYDPLYPIDPFGWTVGGDGTVVPNSGPKGAFKAFCSGSVFLASGAAVFGPTSRGLDGFPTRVEGDEVVVDLTSVVLGECRTDTYACSAPGRPLLVASLPPPIRAPAGEP